MDSVGLGQPRLPKNCSSLCSKCHGMSAMAFPAPAAEGLLPAELCELCESLRTLWVPAGLQQHSGCCFQPLRESCRPAVVAPAPANISLLTAGFAGKLPAFLLGGVGAGLVPPPVLALGLWSCSQPSGTASSTAFGFLLPPRAHSSAGWGSTGSPSCAALGQPPGTAPGLIPLPVPFLRCCSRLGCGTGWMPGAQPPA